MARGGGEILVSRHMCGVRHRIDSEKALLVVLYTV